MEVVVIFKSRPVYAQGYKPSSHLIRGWGVFRAGLDFSEKRYLLSIP